MKILNSEKKEVTNINFGIVEVGHTKSAEYFLLNDDGTFVDNIKMTLKDPKQVKEVSISSYDTTLGVDKTTSFTVAWTPTLKVKEGLKIELEVAYRRLFG